MLLDLSSMDAKASGFGFGSTIPITNGIKQVTFNLDKGFRFKVADFPVGLVEIKVDLTNGAINRTSLLYAGGTSLRTPLSVEKVESIGVCFSIFVLLSVVAVLLWHSFRARQTAPGSAPNGPAAGPPSLI